jgi:hypothetical protein
MSSFAPIELNISVTKHDLEIVIVDKLGSLKTVKVKDFKEEDVYKKCGLKKPDGFAKRVEWSTKIDKVKYVVQVHASTDGVANNENKYDFPPPADNMLFFGSCAITCKMMPLGQYTNLTVQLWTKIWEKLFGGFEDLSLTCVADDAEIDELDVIPASKKTKQGYLKDGFVVDSGESDRDEDSSSNEDVPDDNSSEDDEVNDVCDIGSELSEEEYDYSDDDNK